MLTFRLAYQRAYQANNASLAENAEEGAGKTLAEQLIGARKEANDAGTEGLFSKIFLM